MLSFSAFLVMYIITYNIGVSRLFLLIESMVNVQYLV